MAPNYGSWRVRWVLSFILGLLPLLWAPISEGQTTSITSSGLGTKITLNGAAPVPTYDITGGTRPGNGTNLFHSFGEFSVGTHDIARFGNDSGLPTTNILSRVTGGQTSSIYGAIQTSGFGTAALWLINPAGIVFGPSASLNVGGSVHFSTADYLRLGSGNDRFYADLGKASQLTSADVTAFGFLGNSPGKIDVQGGAGSSTLSVSEGHSFSLVGGDISVEGKTIQASGGQINLVSVLDGEVSLTNTGPQLSPGSSLGNISLTAKSATSVGGFPTSTFLTTNVSELGKKAGDIFIRSGQLVMDHSDIQAFATSAGGNENTNEASGGNISLTATSINLSDSLLEVSTIGNRAAGSIVLQGQEIILQNNTNLRGLSTLSLATPVPVGPTGGKAGTVTIEGLNGPASNVTVNNSAITTEIKTAGFAGNPPAEINISSQAVTMTDHASITATSQGAAPTGNIHIAAGTFTMNPGTNIKASTTGAANAGNISITASEQITLSGAGTKVATDTSSTGNAGSITLNTNQLTINNGGSISSSSTSKSETARSAGQIMIRGQAGGDNYAESVVLDDGTIETKIAGGTELSTPANIDIRGQSVALANAALINAQTSGTAPGGNIHIETGTLGMTSEAPIITSSGPLSSSTAFITTGTSGPGRGGDITINATDHGTLSGGQLGSASTGQTGEFINQCPSTCGPGGNITITAPVLTLQSIEVRPPFFGLFKDSGISTQTNGSGAGGNITLDVGSLLIRDSIMPSSLAAATNRHGVSAGTIGSGAGGSIKIIADSIRLEHGLITAEAGDVITRPTTGAPGTIDISAWSLTLMDGSLIRASNNGPTSSHINPDGTVTEGGTVTIYGKGNASFSDTVSISDSTLFTGTRSLSDIELSEP